MWETPSPESTTVPVNVRSPTCLDVHDAAKARTAYNSNTYRLNGWTDGNTYTQAEWLLWNICGNTTFYFLAIPFDSIPIAIPFDSNPFPCNTFLSNSLQSPFTQFQFLAYPFTHSLFSIPSKPFNYNPNLKCTQLIYIKHVTFVNY